MAEKTRIREYVYCWKCKTGITWEANNPNDSEFYGVIAKLEDHQERLECIREQKLTELLNEK
jgi:hypothetical protein